MQLLHFTLNVRRRIVIKSMRIARIWSLRFLSLISIARFVTLLGEYPPPSVEDYVNDRRCITLGGAEETDAV